MGAETELTIVYRGEDESLGRTTKDAEGAVSRISGAAKAAGLAIAAGIAVGTAAIVGAGIKMVGLASDAAEMQGKFDVVFANVGGAVTRELDDFAAGVGRSKFELRGMASDLGDILKPLGFTEEAAGDAAVEMVKLAADLGSFNDMPMDEALDRLRGTLVGSHENALAFGVVINENMLKAELAAQGWDTLTGSALEQAKVQARINLLLAGTTDAQGDAARTADSFANRMVGMKAALTDAGTEIGLMLLPAIELLMEKVGGPLMEAIGGFVGILEDARISEYLEAFVGKLLDGDWQGAFDVAREGFLNLLGELGVGQETLDKINKWFGGISGFASKVGYAIDKFKEGDYAGALAELAGGIDILGEAFGINQKLLDPFKESLIMFGDWLAENMPRINQLLGNTGDAMGEVTKQTAFWGVVAAWVNKLVLVPLSTLLGGLSAILALFTEGPMSALNEAWELFLDLGTRLLYPLEVVQNWFADLVGYEGSVRSFADAMIYFKDGIIALPGVLSDIWENLGDLIEGLSGLSIPDWLMPGSPTPFELGLRGISSAMDDLNRRSLPAFGGGFGQNGGGITTNNTRNSNPVFNIYTQSYDARVDLRSELAFGGGV